MTGKGEFVEGVGRDIEFLKTSIVSKSISRSTSLVMLTLEDVAFGEHCPLDLMLAKTEESVGATILASGLSDNHSLANLHLQCTFVESECPETFRALCEGLRGNTTLRS
jgi:hypothetical protein